MKKTVSKMLAIVAMVLGLFAMPGSSFGATGDPYLGSIDYMAITFTPRGYVNCDGQLLAISQHPALYALLGTTYGGDGTTAFAVPDMRGRVPIHVGYGPGLENFVMGQKNGAITVALTANNLAAHNHSVTVESTSTSTLSGVNSFGNVTRPAGSAIAKSSTGDSNFSTVTPTAEMHTDSVYTNTSTVVTQQSIGSGQAFSIMQPYTVLRCVMAVEGLFPPRS